MRVFWERYGERRRRPSCCCPPGRSCHSRMWKAQIPYFARHFRVVTFDPRGNGRSDRPRTPALYAEREFAADAVAVIDATRHRAGRVASRCRAARSARCCSPRSIPSGCWRQRLHRHPVPGRAGCTGCASGSSPTRGCADRCSGRRSSRAVAQVQRRALARATTTTSSTGSATHASTTPHSTKQIEDAIGWASRDRRADAARQRDRQARRARDAARSGGAGPAGALSGARDPRDRTTRSPPTRTGRRWPRQRTATWRPCPTAGTAQGTQAGAVNLALRRASCERTAAATAEPPRSDGAPLRRAAERALYVSSPIGLGHAQRDVAIAQRAPASEARPRDRLAGAAPGDARCSRARASAIHPGQRAPGQRVAPHRVRVGRARPALLPGAGAGWTRS